MKKVLLFSLIIFFSIVFKNAFADTLQVINDYHSTFIPCYDKNSQLRIAIRMYEIGTTPYYLVVDPFTFHTESRPVADFATRPAPNHPTYFEWEKLQQTPYIKALMHYTDSPYPLQNDGVIQADHPVNGEFLTVDMCPSSKPFEEQFFQTLVQAADKTGKPTPVALSITGLWIISHPQEFQWLLDQETKNKLQITWINHSFSHLYYPDLPLEKNFLLFSQTNLTQEILATEKILLEHQQLPSVFFRAPGLVTDKKLILKLRHFGLIPVGSNAWLAKDEKAKPGSIILVHGNSNEHKGIQLFLDLWQQTHPTLLPLNQLFLSTATHT